MARVIPSPAASAARAARTRTSEKTKPLADRGASVAATPAQAARTVDIAITMGQSGRPGAGCLRRGRPGRRARHPHHVGELGAGAAAKVVNNSTLGAAIAAFGEALALGDALRLDRSALLDVLADSPIGSTVRAKRANVESGRYPPNFKLRLALKDLRLVTEVASRAGRRLEVAPATRDWLERAANAGAGDLDFSAVIETIVGDTRRNLA
jgi:3-hydroxyisobutyrate dehydrogenase-like beta-hydroxyacid dehydrogenase